MTLHNRNAPPITDKWAGRLWAEHENMRVSQGIDLPGLRHPPVIFTRKYGIHEPIILRVFGIPSGNLASTCASNSKHVRLSNVGLCIASGSVILLHSSQQNHSDRSRTVLHANMNGYISVPFLSVPFKTELLQLPVENGTVKMGMRTSRSTRPVRVLRNYTSRGKDGKLDQ